jgi:glycosyltransferase involved in cell wall biosynthesis
MTSPPERLHVVHYLGELRLEQGGGVRTVLDLCAAMSGLGHRVTLLTGEAADAPAGWTETSTATPRVIRVSRMRGGLLAPGARRTIDPVLADADVLHLHGPWAPANLQLARWARRRALPYVVSIHGMLDDWSMGQKSLKKRVFLALGARSLLERAARVHCTAEEELRQSRRWYPRGTSAVVQCMCDLSPFDAQVPANAATAGPPRVLFLSRVHPKKGVDLLIEAMALVRDRNVPFELIIAGPGDAGYVRELEQMVTHRRLSDRVRMIGMVSDLAEKVALYRSARLFVLPTSQENFGIVLVEAMASGVPVVTTQGVAIWRELEDGGGVIVPRTAPALAEAIATLLGDLRALAERGARSQAWVRRYASADVVAGQFDELYRAAIATSGSAP